MKAKKKRQLKAKLKALKQDYKQAKKTRKQHEKQLRKAEKKEADLEKAVQELRERLQPSAPPPKENTAGQAPSEGPGAPLATDNLREITGLGPKFEQLLHEAGITTFAQLHAMSREQWAAIFEQAGARYRNFDPTPWQEEARQLMQGEAV